MASRVETNGTCAFLCALAMSVSTFGQPTNAGTAPAVTPLNAIQMENLKTGTSAWQIGLPPYVNSNDTDQWIRGYASAVSINKGEKITFNITVNPYNWKTNPASVPYTIDVYRIGWYNGLGGRLMKHLGPFPGKQQPGGTSSGGVTTDPCGVTTVGASDYAATGIIACQWSGDGLGNGSYTLDTSLPPDGSNTSDWTSGIYLALLTTQQVQYPTGCGSTGNDPCDPDHQSYIIFAIREDSRNSQILYQQPVSSYEAYNNYPSDGTYGKSLYDSGSFGPTPSVFSATEPTATRAANVSFDRPYTYTDHTGAGDFLHWELYFVRWMERNGYDVTYTTDVDTHSGVTVLTNHKAALVVGHPEYWTHEMRQAFETARDSGVSLAFFAANSVYSQIRLEPSQITGSPNRVIVAYKDALADPDGYPFDNPNISLTTVPFRSDPLDNPEQTLLGSMYADYFNAELPAAPYVVQNSTNWVYAGTNFSDGSSIPGITGYELDQVFSNFPGPVADPNTYFSLSNSPFTGANGTNFANATIYEAPSGAWVFNAATIDWSWGLDNYVPPAGIDTRGAPAPSAQLQKITANLLTRFLAARPASPTNLNVTASTNKIVLSWTDNAADQTGFVVERSNDGISFIIQATLGKGKLSYSDGTVLPGAGYYYRVAAFNTGGNSRYATLANAVGTPPAAPSNLTGTHVGTSQIDLTWYDNSSNETGFILSRSTNNVNFTTVVTTGPDVKSYSDTGLLAGTKYYYHVVSFNSFGSSSFASTAVQTLKK